ncbi:NfeD family protein [Cyanobium sp. FGCU-52]|nr:NfeD family protein [Cyanobium sp. FGCU52]
MAIAPLWLLLALALLALVLVGIDSDGLLLMGGLAGLVLALVSALTPLPTVVQILLWGAIVAGGYGLLRRWSARHGERMIPPAAGAEQAEVIAGFDADGLGRVRWQGQSWAALNLDPSLRPGAGSRVTVLGREGTRLWVLPAPPALTDGEP